MTEWKTWVECKTREIFYDQSRLLEMSVELKLSLNVWTLLSGTIPSYKMSSQKCYKSLQPTLNCWVETCDLVETISPSLFLVNMKATPPRADFDYKPLKTAVRGRHPHACIRSEILQVKEWWRQGALTTRKIKISKWNVLSCQSLLKKRNAFS